MRATDVPVLKDLVLLGGGHSHVTVLRRFGMRPLPGVRLTLISREIHAPYSGMLPGLVAGHYGFDDAHIDLAPLARFARARLVHAEVVGLDLAARRVLCRGRPPLVWDVLSIDTGAAPSVAGVPGAAGVVVPVKPIDRFLARWEEVRARCRARAGETHVGVVGAGAGGVELLLAVRHRLRRDLAAAGRRADHLRFHLVSATPEILPELPAAVRARFARILGARGIDVRTGRAVARVAPGRVWLAGGAELALDEILWVTTAGAPSWPREAGLAVDERGFVAVHPTLQSVSHAHVFAAGDVAAVEAHPRPKAGVFAVRQGPPLAANLRRRLRGRTPRPLTPQRRFLTLISTGDRYAVAARGEWSAEGRLVWRWKDWIDRRFIRRYTRLPAMAAPAPPPIDRALAGAADAAAASAMRCAGCGSKVAGDVLARVLGRLREAGAGRSDGTAVAEDAVRAPATPPLAGAAAPGAAAATAAASAFSHPPATDAPSEPAASAPAVAASIAPAASVPASRIVVGLDAPDDAAVWAPPPGMLVVASVDFFRAPVDDPFVFGQIAANHALGDVLAMGAAPQSALAIATVPWAPEAKVEELLVQVMTGALAILAREGAALVGGHTTEGAELALGFAVHGVVAEADLRTKCGLRPGDALVLTKALGTGALFAAAMRGQARGRWIEAAVAAMTQSGAAAARCLVRHGARAMTDVTGFGLVGHLREMTVASEVAAELRLEVLPALDGALEVLDAGVASSLQDANVRLGGAAPAPAAAGPRHALAHDPQTAGGLLAGVPAERAAACVAELRRLGYAASAVVGVVTAPVGARGAVTLVA